MIYDKLINRILIERKTQLADGYIPIIEADGSLAGERERIQQKISQEYRDALIAKGYTFSPINMPQEEMDRQIALTDHDPLNPSASIEEAEEVLKRATNRLGLLAPGWKDFVQMQPNVFNHPDVKTAAVDHFGNMFLNVDFITKLAKGEGISAVVGLILHEVAHIGMDDHARMMTYVKDKPDNRRWNIASDYVNNWLIINDMKQMNASYALKKNKQAPTVGLPSCGLFPNDDGKVDHIIVNGEKLNFPASKVLDLNNRSTLDLYVLLKEIDDEILDIMNNNRIDAHVQDIYADDVTEVYGGTISKEEAAGSGSQQVVKLERVLVLDKLTNKPGIITSDDSKNGRVKVVPLTREQYQDILQQSGLSEADMPYDYPEETT